jgi:hypothetical protein
MGNCTVRSGTADEETVSGKDKSDWAEFELQREEMALTRFRGFHGFKLKYEKFR